MTVVVTVAVVMAVGTFVDYRREYQVHLDEVFASLDEQAHALRTARKRIADDEAFVKYVNDFCASINEFVSPGHHILVLDARNQALARAHHHRGTDVEKVLLAAGPKDRLLNVGTHRLAQVRIRDEDGATIILAQYLDHMEGILRSQLISRAATALASAAALVGLLYLVIHLWVIRPLARLMATGKAWGQRDFSVRSEATGPADLRRLVAAFNTMAAELDSHEKRRVAELENARMIQANLLPAKMPQIPGMAAATAYRPAEHIGGDLYDVIALPDGSVAVAILDVGGHGISAALLTGVVKMSLHWHLADENDPALALERVNHDLQACDHLVTVCVGLWNPDERTWTYASAGHPGGFLLSENRVRTLASSGPPVGILTDCHWERLQVTLNPGDRLFLHTDGIVDAGVPDNRLGDAGVIRILEGTGNQSLKEQVSCLMDNVVAQSGGNLPDDATLIALEALA